MTASCWACSCKSQSSPPIWVSCRSYSILAPLRNKSWCWCGPWLASATRRAGTCPEDVLEENANRWLLQLQPTSDFSTSSRRKPKWKKSQPPDDSLKISCGLTRLNQKNLPKLLVVHYMSQLSALCAKRVKESSTFLVAKELPMRSAGSNIRKNSWGSLGVTKRLAGTVGANLCTWLKELSRCFNIRRSWKLSRVKLKRINLIQCKPRWHFISMKWKTIMKSVPHPYLSTQKILILMKQPTHFLICFRVLT